LQTHPVHIAVIIYLVTH